MNGHAAVADPDLELREGPGFVLLALPAFLLSVISSFLPKIRGAQAPRAPPLDLPLEYHNMTSSLGMN